MAQSHVLDYDSHPVTFYYEHHENGNRIIETLKHWVAKYRIYGIAAFADNQGNSTYTSEFKTMCVESVLSDEGSVDDIVAKHNIFSRQVLRHWIMKYNANRELKDYDPKGGLYGRCKKRNNIRRTKGDC